MQEGNQKFIHFLGGSVCTSVLDKEVKLLCSGLSFCCISVSFKIPFLIVNKYVSLNSISSKLTELKESGSLDLFLVLELEAVSLGPQPVRSDGIPRKRMSS